MGSDADAFAYVMSTPTTRDITETFVVLRSAFRERDAALKPAASSAAAGKEGAVGAGGGAGGAADGGGGAAGGGEGGAAAGSVAPLERGLYDALGDTGMHVQDMIKMCDTKMEVLRQLHTERLMNGFDEAANADTDAQIGSLTTSIKSGFKQGQAFLQAVAVEQGTATGRIALNMRKQLALTMQDRVGKFRRMQKEYMDKLDDNPAKQTTVDIQAGLDAGSESAMQLQAIDMMLMDETDAMEALATEREVEITKIVQSMTELNEMFRDLASLVEDQGQMVERIDAQMESVHLRTQKGLDEIKAAAKKQKQCVIS